MAAKDPNCNFIGCEHILGKRPCAGCSLSGAVLQPETEPYAPEHLDMRLIFDSAENRDDHVMASGIPVTAIFTAYLPDLYTKYEILEVTIVSYLFWKSWELFINRVEQGMDAVTVSHGGLPDCVYFHVWHVDENSLRFAVTKTDPHGGDGDDLSSPYPDYLDEDDGKKLVNERPGYLLDTIHDKNKLLREMRIFGHYLKWVGTGYGFSVDASEEDKNLELLTAE